MERENKKRYSPVLLRLLLFILMAAVKIARNSFFFLLFLKGRLSRLFAFRRYTHTHIASSNNIKIATSCFFFYGRCARKGKCVYAHTHILSYLLLLYKKERRRTITARAYVTTCFPPPPHRWMVCMCVFLPSKREKRVKKKEEEEVYGRLLLA
jgi:hypothetical protein